MPVILCCGCDERSDRRDGPRALGDSVASANRLDCSASPGSPASTRSSPAPCCEPRRAWTGGATSHRGDAKRACLHSLAVECSCLCALLHSYRVPVLLCTSAALRVGPARWEELKSNVDNLKLIQFGLALSNEAGKPPPGCAPAARTSQSRSEIHGRRGAR